MRPSTIWKGIKLREESGSRETFVEIEPNYYKFRYLLNYKELNDDNLSTIHTIIEYRRDVAVSHFCVLYGWWETGIVTPPLILSFNYLYLLRYLSE